jgi:hypothetical protein
VIGSSLAIPSTTVDGVEENDEVDEDDEDGEDGPTGRARMCCQSKPTGEQRLSDPRPQDCVHNVV